MASLKMRFSSHPTRLLRPVYRTASNVIYDYRSDADGRHRVAPCFRLLAQRPGLSRSLASHVGWFGGSAQGMPGRFIQGGEDVEHNDEWDGIVPHRTGKMDAPGPLGGPGAGGERG